MDRKQVDFGREKEVFPLVLIQVKSAAKRTVFGLKNKREKTFLPFKTQLFHIQVVRYAASKLKKTLPNDINQDDIFDYIKKHDLIEKVDLIEYDKIRQNLLL